MTCSLMSCIRRSWLRRLTSVYQPVSHFVAKLLLAHLNYQYHIFGPGTALSHNRYSFCYSCSCWGDALQKSPRLCRFNRIGMKLGRNVLQVNTHRLTDSDFGFGSNVIRSFGTLLITPKEVMRSHRNISYPPVKKILTPSSLRFQKASTL